MTDWSELQKQTANELSPCGLEVLEGEPCECGGEAYNTSKSHGYSDTIVYNHRCSECGNRWKTWTEG